MPAAPAAPAVTPASSKAACTPASKEDLSYATCSAWCKADYKVPHCVKCACKECGFCLASNGGPNAPLPAPKFASTMGRACTSSAQDDGNVEDCKVYCQEKHAAAHCDRCDCKGCGFCSSGQLETCSPYNAGDSHVAGCEPFCNTDRAKDHCPLCRCKKCGFCKTSKGGPAVPRCEPHDASDSDIAGCETFCKAQHAVSHCPLCRCRECGFCAASRERHPPPPPDSLCATVGKAGSWSGGSIAQIRVKVWEAGSLVRLTWDQGVELKVASVAGASLSLAVSNVLTFGIAHRVLEHAIFAPTVVCARHDRPITSMPSCE